jgi:hypothetical protein
VIGGSEEDVPAYWASSVDIAQAWERELNQAQVPATRKVALRAAMVMTPDSGGVVDVLSHMARLGLGGPVAGGGQYVSWIHEDDFTAAVRFIIDHDGSRRVVPARLTMAGYQFKHAAWPEAARDLVRRPRAR